MPRLAEMARPLASRLRPRIVDLQTTARPAQRRKQAHSISLLPPRGIPRLAGSWVGTSRRDFATGARTPATRDVSFSGSGLLVPYHLGVASVLQAEGIITEHSRFAGASGGSIAAASLGGGVPIPKTMELLRSMTAELREKGAWLNMERALRRVLQEVIDDESEKGAWLNMERALRPVLQEVIDDKSSMSQELRENGTWLNMEKALRRVLAEVVDDRVAARCATRLQVAVTQVSPSPKSPVMVGDFRGGADLIDALVASCFIPAYLAPALTTVFRNEATP
ncbi:acyl transferase/acyl hydrolase/lysophospholipase [Baffinella frigidus]|nr:acyl transferase/acyl hydrolase/lysophospholipase [Cryptophyta sp. CCMP2293]